MFLRARADLLRRITFVLVGVGLGWVLAKLGYAAAAGPLGEYLIAMGVMAGGTIAIVFAISVFLLQSASDLYSSSHLDAYIHDWREKLIYSAVILATLILIAGGLLVGAMSTVPPNAASRVVTASLGLVGMVFALIDWQYKGVREKINPLKAILFLERQALSFLQELQDDAERLANILRAADDEVPEGLALATVYNRLLQPRFGTLEGQLERLSEISIRLEERQETGTCRRSITASLRILDRYLQARATSSLIVPSDVSLLATESDSDAFLVRSLERLNRIADRFVRDGDDELVVHLLNGYSSLGATASRMQFVSGRLDNPVFARVVAYSGLVVASGQRSGNMEIVFQGAGVLGELATIAAREGLDASLLVLQDRLTEAAAFGFAGKHVVVVDRCIGILLGLIPAVFATTRLTRRHQLDNLLEKLAQVAASAEWMTSTGSLPRDFSWQGTVTKAYDDFPQVLGWSLAAYSRMPDESAKRRFRYDLTEFFEETTNRLRRVAETLRTADSSLAGSIGRALLRMNHVMVDLAGAAEFADVRRQLHDRLRWSIHVPSFFSHHASRFDGGSLGFRDLTESVATTGILLSERLGDADLLRECVKAIHVMTHHCLAKTTSHYGYDEPRTLEKACYLGILALKHGWLEIFSDVRNRISEFEPKYVAKYLMNVPDGIDPMNHNVMGLPHHDQLLRELLRWRQDLRMRTSGLLPNSEHMMAQLVTEVDLDRFILEVWRVRVAGSQVEADLTSARRELLALLERYAAGRQAEG